MGADYSVHLACEPKTIIGEGDPWKGSNRIRELLKARSQLEVIEETARRIGKSPQEIRLTTVAMGPHRPTTQSDTAYDRLVAQVAPLEAHGHSCEGCPANLFAGPFGCFGFVPYPISSAAEEWLMGRVQPTSTVGGFLCHRSMQDFGYTGEPIRAMRASGLFESTAPLSKVVEGSWLSKKKVTSDQLLQGMIAFEDPIQPSHCIGVLVWLGCVRIDGQVPGDATDISLVQGIFKYKTPEERAHHTALEISSAPKDQSTASFHGLLHAFYLAWVWDCPILMSY